MLPPSWATKETRFCSKFWMDVVIDSAANSHSFTSSLYDAHSQIVFNGSCTRSQTINWVRIFNILNVMQKQKRNRVALLNIWILIMLSSSLSLLCWLYQSTSRKSSSVFSQSPSPVKSPEPSAEEEEVRKTQMHTNLHHKGFFLITMLSLATAQVCVPHLVKNN